MEELYRRVSDHQTMGSVVDELRATLAEAEKSMDQFFRNPEDVAALKPVPGCLQQMRGVLSVLGLDQASLAVVRMRDTVERLLINDIPAQERQGVFEKLGNSLGALGFLIDMLSYQRTMARKLFVYDEELGELRILMGRVRTRAADSPREAEAALESRGQEPEAELAFPDAPELTEPSPAQDTAPALLVDLDFSLPATQEAAVSSPCLWTYQCPMRRSRPAWPLPCRRTTMGRTNSWTSSWRKRGKWWPTAWLPSRHCTTNPET